MRRVDETEMPADPTIGEARRPEVELTIILTCRNHETALAGCLRAAMSTLDNSGVVGEVIVADYGSTDNSVAIARMHGARVVQVKGGHGAAVRAAAQAADGELLLIAAADGRFDLREFPRFVMRLRAGSDVVVGCRWKRGGGAFTEGARPTWMHRMASSLCDLLASRVFGVSAEDTQCGMRGVSREFFQQLHLNSDGVEFDSEMLVKASLLNGRITQAPVTIRQHEVRDRTWAASAEDAWRRVRPFVLMCPQWTLMFPSYLLMMLGVIGFFAASWDSMLTVRGIHAPLYGLSALAVIVGFQLLQFGLYAKTQAGRRGVLPLEQGVERDNESFSLERGAALSLTAVVVGIGFLLLAFNRATGAIDWLHPSVLCLAAPGVTLIALGIQLFAGELTTGLLALADRPSTPSDLQAPKPMANVRPETSRSRRQRPQSPWESLNPRRRMERSHEPIQNSSQHSRREEQTDGTDANDSFSQSRSDRNH